MTVSRSRALSDACLNGRFRPFRSWRLARALQRAVAVVAGLGFLTLVLPVRDEATAGAGRVTEAPTPSGTAGHVWPVGGADGVARPRVIREWAPPPEPWSAGHRGADLAGSPGAAVRAVATGRISFAGDVAGRGVVSIELTDTGTPPLRTTYTPVRPSVRKGERVRAGETVARLSPGSAHCAETCLHWGLLRGDTYLDPLSLLPPELRRRGPSRLLPVFGVPLPASTAGARAEASPHAAGVLAHPRQAGWGSTGAWTALPLIGAALWARRRLGSAERQPRTPRRAMPTAASTISDGSSAAPSSILRTAASTTPCSSIAVSRGCS